MPFEEGVKAGYDKLPEAIQANQRVPLPAAASADTLTVRRPDVIRSGFFLDARGTVLTNETPWDDGLPTIVRIK
ncbi:MAG: hypothetical protein HC802_03995 [Caldilineaceae bacterium]|nr:hypothetical protein [Caldilineaceae bacterium]